MLNYAYAMEADENTDTVNWVKVEVHQSWESKTDVICMNNLLLAWRGVLHGIKVLQSYNK